MTTNDVYDDFCDDCFDIYYTCESLIYTSFSDLLWEKKSDLPLIGLKILAVFITQFDLTNV